MSHPMLPEANHDEQAEQLFVRDLKIYLASVLDPQEALLACAIEREIGASDDADGVEAVCDRLMEHEVFRAYVDLRRTSQEMMWDAVAASVGRQLDQLQRRAAAIEPKGSLRLDPDFVAPRYLTDFDIHLMPGGYGLDGGAGSVRQGAVMDRGGAVYMLGANGGMMNDGRGQTVAAHLFDLYPDFRPRRILELGCGVGVSLVPMADGFPDADVHGVDVGADMLRYAHARAEHLGVALHLAQQNAEATDFEDGAFDLVFSCVLFHETSAQAVGKIMAECHRLLRPGGLTVHLEVPQRYSEMDLWGRIRGELETHYNNEPFWRGAISVDYEAVLKSAGFDDIRLGWRPGAGRAQRGEHAFSTTPLRGPRDWFLASARK